MNNNELTYIDSEDLEDLLIQVETSFGITFADQELAHITTFGELCDHITNKIQLENKNDCTSQQAFYKLRKAISSALNMDPKNISINLPLADILPRKSRRSHIKKIEAHLGFTLNILQPHGLAYIVLVLLITSFVVLFFNTSYGLLGMCIFSFIFWISIKTANELNVRTVGQLAEKMAREHYSASRRDPDTFNKNEIEKVLTDWFSNSFGFDKQELTRDMILKIKFYPL